MIENKRKITIPSPYSITSKYTIESDDLEYYISLIENGEEQKAIDLFIAKYMVAPAIAYNTLMEYYLAAAEQGEIPEETEKKIEKNIALFSYGFSTLLSSNFNILSKQIIAPGIFKERGIKTEKVKNTILNATVGQFESLTSKTLTGTQVDILKNIRNIQKDMIIFNQGKGSFLKGVSLDKEIKAFQTKIMNKFPDYYKMLDGKIVATKPYGPNNTIRYYKLEDYIEMSTRTTLLNIDRIATQITIENKEDEREAKGRTPVKVAVYYQRDNRPLKTGIEREICKDILSDKRYGAPLLALDQITADALGIMTIEEAMGSKDGAMGPYCRHSLKPSSVFIRKKLERILRKKFKETSNVK